MSINNYRAERSTVRRLKTRKEIISTIAGLENRIVDCERFYRWPALIESYKQDIEFLRARLLDSNDPAT